MSQFTQLRTDSEDDSGLPSHLMQKLSRALDYASENQLVLTGAESLTAGGVSALIASIPGASRVFTGSFVTYSHEFKTEAIGVSRNLIASQGAVDPEVAAQMASGAKLKTVNFTAAPESRVISFATTGVAGPDPSDGKPVGLVYVAIASHIGEVVVREFRFSGDRNRIRSQTIEAVIELLVEQLLGVTG